MTRVSLSTISTVEAPFDEDVRAYAAAGFDGIGLWEMKLPADDAANRAALAGAGLTVTNCVATIPSILQLGIPGLEGPADPEERIAALCASIERLAAYGPDCVALLTGPATGRSLEEARAIVVDGVRRIAEVARRAGVKLGFEPIHVRDRAIVSFVNDLDDALALLDEAGARDVGLLIDTIHVWDEPLDAIQAVAPRVVGVHVCDLPSDPAQEGRALPGENGTRTRDIVDALRAGGWDGPVDVEIFSTADGFWGLPVDEAARRAHEAALTLL